MTCPATLKIDRPSVAHRSDRFLACVCILCVGVLLAEPGCSKDGANNGAIQGEVKLDGKPLEQGTIRFLPAQGVKGAIAATEIVKGKYQFTGKAGPAVGMNRVEINGVRKTGRVIKKVFPQHGTTEETVEAIAPRFNSKSTLTFEIKPGDNTADFEVTSK